jgi:hypothetical protein
MANVTINSTGSNVIDSQSYISSVSLDGVPNTVSTIITGRKITPTTNYKFTKQPHVSFAKTSDPNRYNYTVVANLDGSYSFTVKYHHALTQPTDDVIEFFAEAKTDKDLVSRKVFGWNMADKEIKPSGETRKLKITGDPGARLKYRVVKTTVVSSPTSVDVHPLNTVVIGADGCYETFITFPSATARFNYTITLMPEANTTFGTNLINSSTITLRQWPFQKTKLQIIETNDTTWVLPAAGVGSDHFIYSKARGGSTHKEEFTFTCTHTGDISFKNASGIIVPANFTQAITGATVLSPIQSRVTYDELNYVIDNTASPNTVVITGQITIAHEYDAGGETLITLNVNDILLHA